MSGVGRAESLAVPMKPAPVPDRGIHVAVEGIREVLRVGRPGGYPAWSALAAQMMMEYYGGSHGADGAHGGDDYE